MRLEKIVGPDSRSVMEKLRRSFGDEALVISNSRSENKNEIIIAIEGDGLVDLVDMAKEPLEIKQVPDKEVTDTDDERAGVTLDILRKELMELRVQHSAGQLKETHKIKEVRRSIAQLKTLNNEVKEDIKDD